MAETELDPQGDVVTLIIDLVTDKRHIDLVKINEDSDQMRKRAQEVMFSLPIAHAFAHPCPCTYLMPI